MEAVLYIISVCLVIAFITQVNLEQNRGYKITDGIDIQVEIMPVPFDELSSASEGEHSSSIRERVIAARAIQSERYRDIPAVHCNAQMTSALIKQHVRLDSESIARIRDAMERLDMSARAYDRILKVARTIADLDGSADVLPRHVSEAINYRSLDRGSWGSTAPKLPF